ncbi:hypothetical protein Srufu_051350 [Streptomyces libani subsp. rufus]|nr:hypothetical protein Srufu_051350 [Streptomyces libani subsp. rufus]
MSARQRTLLHAALGAVSGLVAGYAALAVAELAAVAVRPEASPVTAVGGAAIDPTPAGVKDWAIRNKVVYGNVQTANATVPIIDGVLLPQR